ncbi:hypothetical protein Hanom_Chr07g00621411 [Helianthus anomalus]
MVLKYELSHHPQVERNFVPKFSMYSLRKLVRLRGFLVFLGYHTQSIFLIQTPFHLVYLILHHSYLSLLQHHLSFHMLTHLFHHLLMLMLLPHLLLCPMFIVQISRSFLQEIPAPRPGEGTSGQPPRFDPFTSADFPHIPHSTPFTPASLYEPFRWFPPYSMPISDPYHPSHYGGYTRDELLLSLQLQFAILSRRVLELEFGEGDRRSPFPFHPTSIPPPSPSASCVPPPAAPTSISGFDADFLTFEHQISFLIRRVQDSRRSSPMFAVCSFSHILLLHQYRRFLVLRSCSTFGENATIEPRLQRHEDHFLVITFVY